MKAKLRGVVEPFCEVEILFNYEATTGNDWPGDPGVENMMAQLLAIELGQLQHQFFTCIPSIYVHFQH